MVRASFYAGDETSLIRGAAEHGESHQGGKELVCFCSRGPSGGCSASALPGTAGGGELCETRGRHGGDCLCDAAKGVGAGADLCALRRGALVGRRGLCADRLRRDLCAVECGDFFADDLESGAHVLVVHGIGNTQAFVAVVPVRARGTEEKVFPGDDDDAALFQVVIKLP